MDLTCPICLNVYFKPVKLPCSHTLCQSCLEKSLEISTLACPICRCRLSVWKRRLKDTSACIDKSRETEIEHLFPKYYSARIEGLEASLTESELSVLREVGESNENIVRLATPGSIKSEFDDAFKRLNRNRLLEANLQEEANLALSRHILLESSIDNNSSDDEPIVQYSRHSLTYLDTENIRNVIFLPRNPSLSSSRKKNTP
uniref:RING-type E3 ubiquitin transferase n=1 Tax=Mesocestoides corti TaxID=53468 RepID=A0A5K3F025_MESCO